MMKENQTIDISFAGAIQEKRVKEGEVRGKEAKKLLREQSDTVVVMENSPELAPSTKEVDVKEIDESLDPYVIAIDSLFAGYQAFQVGMKDLPKVKQHKFIFGMLMDVLNAFQGVIAEFKKAEYLVPTEFQKGHNLILEGIEKYDQFLVEYPIVLQGKPGMSSMKKATKLGKLSADADQDMKKAFRAFDEATQEM